MQPGFCRFDGPSLHKKNAGNDLKRVRHAVAQLGEEHLLLLQELLQGTLGLSPLGRVLEGEQNGRLAIAFVEHLPGIEQHRAMPDPREVALDSKPSITSCSGTIFSRSNRSSGMSQRPSSRS